MRTWIPALLLLTLWPLSASSGVRSYGDLDGARFIYCFNGEVCAFSIPGLHPLVGERIAVVVAGIDAPDLVARCPAAERKARRARRALSELLRRAQHIRLRRVRRDRYFRIKAVVEADGRDVADVLIERGLAHPYYGRGEPVSWC